MKKLLIPLCLLFSPFVFANGDGDYGNLYLHRIDVYEYNLNLYYRGIYKELTYMNDREKEVSYEAATNLAIYNPVTDSIKYLFPDTSKDAIMGFFFESDYDKENQCIIFNNSRLVTEDGGEISDPEGIMNNRKIKEREISQNLVIITYSHQANQYTLWICDKHGNNLKNSHSFAATWQYHLDVRNRMVRILTQTNGKLRIVNKSY